MYHQEMRRDEKMGKRIARGARGWGVGWVVLVVALIVAVAACGDSGGETPTSAPTPTAIQVVATSTLSPVSLIVPKLVIGNVPYYKYLSESEPDLVMIYATITGTLTYDGEQVIPEGAQIGISARSTGQRGGFSTFHTDLGTTHFPIPFAIHCNPCAVDPGEEYFGSVEITGPVDGTSRWIGGFIVLGERVEEIRVGEILFLNARKTILIDDKTLAKDIEIPVVPQPTLTGNLTTSEGESISADASGSVQIRNVSRKDGKPITIGFDWIKVGEQFPIPFSIDYHPTDIDPNGTYVLEAELKRFQSQACKGLYRHKEVYEVITGDNPTHDIQLGIVQVDKWIPGEMARVTGTVAYANRDEGGESDPSSEEGDTDPLIYVLRPGPNQENPWHLEIIDLTKDCTLAEIQIDGSMPLPFSFSIPYDRSHIDPNSDYAIRAYHSIDLGDCYAESLRGEGAIALTPEDPQDNIGLEVSHWRTIC